MLKYKSAPTTGTVTAVVMPTMITKATAKTRISGDAPGVSLILLLLLPGQDNEIGLRHWTNNSPIKIVTKKYIYKISKKIILYLVLRIFRLFILTLILRTE